MTEPEVHRYVTFALLAFAVPTFLVLTFVTAPYGRHRREGWGPTVPSRVGWILMECPAVVGFVAVFACGRHRAELVPLVLLAIWQVHYVHRTFVFPFRMRATGKRMPIALPLLGLSFNAGNAYVNARWISHLGSYPDGWLGDPRFLLGLAIFAIGLAVNLHADTVLIRLREPGETGYRIPQGGLYRWVTSPNYLGEILEWIGWAVMTWSLAGLAFAVYTTANLAPRALSNHAWYRERFPDYPPGRRALVPFVI
jgi:protein-S-isoprenylcysteine O-methyltransferase Ste14